MKNPFVLLSSLFLLSPIAWAEPAYMRSLAAGWEVRPLLSVGQAAGNGYRMAGLPDGLGTYSGDDGAITLLMNHEIAADKGVIRAHGQTGAFVSRWKIDPESLQMLSGEDLVKRTVPAGLTFNRLCSADLSETSAFYDMKSGKGFAGRLFMNGEEDKSGGRAFAHAQDGTSYALPDLGRIAWENAVARPGGGEQTVVVGLDDIHDGLMLVYVGNKRQQGTVIEQAGLTGGRLFALKVHGERFELVELHGAAKLSGAALKAQADQLGASRFARPEDGAWDTHDRWVFWFAVTDRIGGNSALMKLSFDDVNAVTRGGRIETALRATDVGAEMFDNLTVDGDGRVLIQEDPGDHAHLAAIWLYEPATRRATRLFEADPDRFAQAGRSFMTQDEEHSGIVEVTAMLQKASWFDPARRYYLGTTQVHARHADAALVEYGQLWLISGPKQVSGKAD